MNAQATVDSVLHICAQTDTQLLKHTPPRQWWIDSGVLCDSLHMHSAVRIHTEKLINNDISVYSSPLGSTWCNLPCMITQGSRGPLLGTPCLIN